jgi:hypothetical protein
MRETDLWSYQRQLDRIDEARVDGNFLDALGRPAEIYEQRVRSARNLDYIITNDLDIALSSTKELRDNIPPSAPVRARVRSFIAYLQPTHNIEKVFIGSQETRRCLFPARAVPI